MGSPQPPDVPATGLAPGLPPGLLDASLRSLFASNILPIFFWTAADGFVEANDAFLRLIEYGREEFYRDKVHFKDLASPHDEPTSRRVKHELETYGRTAPFEKTYRLRSGRELPVLIGVSLQPGRSDMGVGYAIDLSERKQVERELGRTEQRFRIALERSPVVLFTQDDRLRYTWVHNPNVEDLGAAFLGKTDEELLDAKSAEALTALKHLVLERARGIRKEVEMFHCGRRWIYDLTIEPIIGAGGETVGIAGAAFDTTERRKVEEALRDSEERERARADELHALMDLVPASVWIAHDRECTRITGSRASYEMLRLPYGANASITAPEDERPANFKVMRDGVEIPPDQLPVQTAARGIPVQDSEHQVVFEDGTVFHLCGNATPLFDDKGEPRGAVSAFVDVTRLKHAEEMLREADRHKGEFLAILSHELRNPLASISNAVQVLGASAATRGDPDLDWASEVIGRQVGNLTRIIDDLLDITRLDRGKIQLRREPTALGPILRRAIETVRPMVEQRRHALAARIEGDGPQVDADTTRLEQVFVNLLSNAAKYTPEGGRIEVELDVAADPDGPGAGEAVVRVRDDGEGIAPELISRVFELFTQADHSLARSQGGLGIGLALVRRLVEKHGGRVEVASAGLGRGSTFTVRLPTLGRMSPPAGPATSVAPPDADAARRVLVVEDNADTARGMVRLLKLSGHHARSAHDGEQALAAIDAEPFDVVLLDIGLPGMSGLEVAARIRSLPGGGAYLLLALSGYGQAEDRERSLAAGFDDHLVKPVNFDAILRAIRRHAGARSGYP